MQNYENNHWLLIDKEIINYCSFYDNMQYHKNNICLLIDTEINFDSNKSKHANFQIQHFIIHT